MAAGGAAICHAPGLHVNALAVMSSGRVLPVHVPFVPCPMVVMAATVAKYSVAAVSPENVHSNSLRSSVLVCSTTLVLLCGVESV